MLRPRRRGGRTEARFGSVRPRDGRGRPGRRCGGGLHRPEHLPIEGPDEHDACDRPHGVRWSLDRRGLPRVRPHGPRGGVAASPRGVSDDVRSVVSAALEVGFDEIVLFQPDASLQRLGRFSPILLKDSTFFLGDVEVGRLATIRSAKDEAPVRGLRGATKNVVIRPEPWKVIPLENLLAFFQGSKTRLLVEVHDVTEAKLAFETMEVGAGGIFLTTSSRTEIRAVRALLESFQQDIRLVRAKITGTRGLGLGDRVCVDTCSLLRRGEGLLVGNTSAGLFLIHAETIETGEVAARPFRVNAGPVHAYIYLPGGTTKYLSELR